MRRFITIVVVVALLVSAFFAGRWYLNQRKASQSGQWQTAVVGTGNLTAMVGATGVVQSSQRAVLIWGTTGSVDHVSVKVGDRVSKGQLLANLVQTSLPQNVILAKADLITLQKSLDDLNKSNVAKTKAMQSVNQVKAALIEAQRVLDKFAEKKYTDALDDARQLVVDKQDELQKAEDNFDPYKDWDFDNATRKYYEQKVTDARLAYNEAVRRLDKMELDKDQAQANLDVLNAQLADAEREYSRLKDGPDPDDITVLEARISAAQATLDLVQVSAPFAGMVTEVISEPGDKVSPGAAVLQLDDLSKLIVAVQVSEVDINRVKIGQPVRLTFDAVLGKEYNGTVEEVSEAGGTTQGVVEFKVTVAMTDADQEVKPGMTAAVNIVVDQLEEVLLVPNRAVRVQDGQRVVYILSNGNLQLVKISLGSSSDTMSEVVGGDLRSGDEVVLNPPQEFSTDGRPPFIQR